MLLPSDKPAPIAPIGRSTAFLGAAVRQLRSLDKIPGPSSGGREQ